MKLIHCLLIVLSTFSSVAQNCIKPDSNKRQQVNYIVSPANIVGQITVHRRFLFIKKDFPSSFSMISPNVLITAGHTFRERLLHAKIKGATIQLGKRKVNGVIQYINQVHYNKNELNIVVNQRFKRRGTPEYDYSYVALPHNISTAFFPLKTFQELPGPEDSVFILGYPGDKQDELWVKGDRKSNIHLKDSLFALYSIYTVHGDSGAPFWSLINGLPVLVGVHGTGNYHGHSCNASILLTQGRIKELQDFIRLHQTN